MLPLEHFRQPSHHPREDEELAMTIPQVAEMPEYAGVLDALLAQAKLEKKTFDRELLARRMSIVAAAGIKDPDEFKKHVLSEEGA